MSARDLLTIGSATEQVGKLVRGSLEVADLPTGSKLNLPVVIANSGRPGPTFLLTANIHGNEVVALIVAHRFLEEVESLLPRLRGRIVCFPSLNPTGNLSLQRYPQFEPQDPNRLWPDAKPEFKKEDDDDGDHLASVYKQADEPSAQEEVWTRLFDIFKRVKPDFHIDLHSYGLSAAMPFIYIDRVLYGGAEPSATDGEEQAKAEVLAKQSFDMAEATCLTPVLENPAHKYIKLKLHRSTSGATLNGLRIPALTIELGTGHVARSDERDAGVRGLFGLLHHWRMLSVADTPEALRPTAEKNASLCPDPKALPEKFRACDYPFAPATGVYDYYKRQGERFDKGDLLAVCRAVDGSKLAEVRAEFPGFVMSWEPGVMKMKGQNLGGCGLPDRLPMTIAWHKLPLKSKL